MVVPYKKGRLDTDTQRGKTMCRHRTKRAIYKPSRDISKEINPVMGKLANTTMIITLQYINI